MIEEPRQLEFMPSAFIGLCLAALCGAFVGMIAGACGAVLAFMTWGS